MPLERESLEVMETLAAFDPASFAFLCEHTTKMRVIARRDRDPLYREALPEDVEAVSSVLGEGVKLDGYETALKSLGEDYDYVLAVA